MLQSPRIPGKVNIIPRILPMAMRILCELSSNIDTSKADEKIANATHNGIFTIACMPGLSSSYGDHNIIPIDNHAYPIAKPRAHPMVVNALESKI